MKLGGGKDKVRSGVADKEHLRALGLRVREHTPVSISLVISFRYAILLTHSLEGEKTKYFRPSSETMVSLNQKTS